MTANTTIPMRSPALLPTLLPDLLSDADGAGRSVTNGLGACGIVTLDSAGACSTIVWADILTPTGVLTGVGDGATGDGAEVAGALPGTAVLDASSPITVGAFTSEFVWIGPEVEMVSARLGGG